MYIFSRSCSVSEAPSLDFQRREGACHAFISGRRQRHTCFSLHVWLSPASADSFLLVTESVQLSSEAGPSLLGQKPEPASAALTHCAGGSACPHSSSMGWASCLPALC